MGRPKRAATGGMVYHVLNRANARMTIFSKHADYEAFEAILEEACERDGMRLLATGPSCPDDGRLGRLGRHDRRTQRLPRSVSREAAAVNRAAGELPTATD